MWIKSSETKFSLSKEDNVYDNNRPPYDTKEGVIEAIKSPEAFFNLIAKRREAGYKNEEHLNEFYVLGKFHLDTCGNCALVSSKRNLGESFTGIEPVMTRQELNSCLSSSANKAKAQQFMLMFDISPRLPQPHLKCSICNKGWDLNNIEDSFCWDSDKVIPLTDWVGKTLETVLSLLNTKADAIYFPQPEFIIRNNNRINLIPKYEHLEHDWQRDEVVNKEGWAGAADGIDNSYIIQEGDELFLNVWEFYHLPCNKQHLTEIYQKRFTEIFEKAGLVVEEIKPIPNEYSQHPVYAPWFEVKAKGLGVIKIGWRKRVINIDCSKVSKRKINIPRLFKNEDVTQGVDFIHAWGWDKATEYLTKIREA